jgi:hypothetical protein
MKGKFNFIWGNLIYSMVVIPSFFYFVFNDSNDKFASLFISALTLPWSFILAFILGALDINISSKLFLRNLILLSFVFLNQIIIWIFLKNKKI